MDPHNQFSLCLPMEGGLIFPVSKQSEVSASVSCQSIPSAISFRLSGSRSPIISVSTDISRTLQDQAFLTSQNLGAVALETEQAAKAVVAA